MYGLLGILMFSADIMTINTGLMIRDFMIVVAFWGQFV